jgi:excisionase family DNA binding protein
MPDSSVSTRIASELLNVHESSVKRWCNAGDLGYWTTPGGHRRIPISRLVSFAESRGLDAEIANFGTAAERVWIGLESARREGNFGILASLVLEWINLDRVDLVEKLVSFLTEQGLGFGLVLDQVLGTAMRRIGSMYAAQELSIGDEHRLTNVIRDALLGIRKVLISSPGRVDSERTAVVGCIRGETHEIGALMVRLLLTRHGWSVIYLGQDVPTEEFFTQCTKHGAELICISVSPPRGRPEVNVALSLLGDLFRATRGVRLAVGGVAVGSTSEPVSDNPFTEIQFFRAAEPFESWITSL